MSSGKRARTAGEGEEEGEAVPVADGFEAPIFGARKSCVPSQAIARAAGT